VTLFSSRDRVRTAFSFSEADRVPAWLGASPEWRELALQHLGLEDDESLSLHVGDDFRRVAATYCGPEERGPTYALSPGTTYRTPFGIERHGYGYGQPVRYPLADVASVSDVTAYAWPDPAWMDVSHVAGSARRHEGEYAVLGGDWSPFYHDAIDLLGMEGLYFRMYDSPALVDAALEHIVDYYAGVSERVFQAAADLIDIFFIGNDFGSQTGPLMGEGLFRRFMIPHLRRLIDLGHAYGLKVLLHCCGGFAPLIPGLIEVGLDGVQSVQPTCRGMDLATLKARFGRDLLLMGGIDTQLLIEGTPEEARDQTRRVLDIMMPGGGYIASPSHDYVLPETPVENVLAVYEAVEEFGNYV
jgi:uroporphyrinogen decarboxylase